MKLYAHILICFATILMVAGCAKEDILSWAGSENQLITFSSSVAQTKATETETETDDAALKSYGKFNVATFLTNDDNTFYYSDVVLYTGSNWESDAERYWPKDYNLNMFAYSPLEDFIVINNAEVYDDYSLTYNCPWDIDTQVDLLVKTLENKSQNDGEVALVFEHALSSIGFKVQIQSESDVRLDYIIINYVNIEKQRTYDFSTQSWEDSQQKYFNLEDNDQLSTSIIVNETLINSTGSVTFDDIDNKLMIIPQTVSSSESEPHYLSVQVAYTLIGVIDGLTTEVTTGVMPLPAPNDESEYKQGEAYTYNIMINGQTI